MKKRYFLIVCFLLIASSLFAGTPDIDGVFDGEAVWGSAVAVADGSAGWSSVNVDRLYVTYDENYAYYSVLFISGGYPAGWMRAAFAINVKTDGGWNCPWGQAVSYVYSPDDEKPDFVPIGRLQDNYAELREWDGSGWLGGETNIFDTEMEWAEDYSYIECRVPRATLGNALTCDVQFYVSGDNDTEHGVFDACPDDEVMTSWNDPTELDNYALDIPIGTPSDIESEAYKIPENIVLAQNYPNPFNPVTTISYHLNRIENVRLTVVNAVGQKVATLVDQQQNPGSYKVDFDASSLTSGVYFYRMTTGTETQVRKMIVLQ